MGKLSDVLQQRFGKKEKKKVTALTEKRAEGDLTAFSSFFGPNRLGEKDKERLSELLEQYAPEADEDTSQDLELLIAITSEVKAINNQAAILHGERIKRAQQILKKYREGIFSAWLLETYGNRQTPYNFLQYYEFYTLMPKSLLPKMEEMPRQAIYTLASRSGDFEEKEGIVRNYNGESKDELIGIIRSQFPLPEKDRRKEKIGMTAIKSLERVCTVLTSPGCTLSSFEKKKLAKLIEVLSKQVEACETEVKR